MKKKIQYTYNKTFFLWLIASLVFFSIADFSFLEKEIGCGIFMIIVGLLALAVGIITPWRYRYDPKGLSICYAFLPNERYLWENIGAICEEEAARGSRPTIFDPFFFMVYEIIGAPEGKEWFYMQGHVYKSLRNKRLLEKYWNGEIETFWKEMKESIGGWWRRKILKKQKALRQHYADKIVPMEREIRARAREAIKPFADHAAQKNLVLRTKFLYVTKDFEELHSRPQAAYTYMVLIEISRPEEQDEDKILVVSADLLRVRLGKTAFEGVEKRGALKSLQERLQDALAAHLDLE